VLRRLAEREAYEVLEAYEREGVLAQIEQGVEVVLLDLMLGDTSGEDLVQEIRARSSDTEVIVVTGYASVDSAVACMRNGAFDYLEKPFDDPNRVLHRSWSASWARVL
jgi:two-component system response regulator HydG